MMQSEINISVGYKPPNEYFSILINNPGEIGGITDRDELLNNYKMNCIPSGMENKTEINYDEFLIERRKLMSEKIKNYYSKL